MVPDNGKREGFDVLNDDLHVYVEMKNKHNTMNSASASATYVKMQNRILKDDKATCMLVEVISKRSQNAVWNVSITQNGFKNNYSHERIRRVSIDVFYEMVFGQKDAFFRLCKALPSVLDDVLKEEDSTRLNISVYDELQGDDFYRSLYLLAFKTYEGFEGF